MQTGPLSITSSDISDNATVLASTFPYFLDGGQTLDMNSNSGGIHMGDNVTATIDSSHIDRNTITVSDPNGEPVAFDAGVCSCTDDQVSTTLTIHNSTVIDNRVSVTVASQADVFPGSGGALELDGPGTVANTQVTGNSVIVRALSGDATANGGVAVADGSAQAVIRNSLIATNVTTAIAPHGTAEVLGGGLANQGPLLLSDDLITHNVGIVKGQNALAEGGGIYNGQTWFQAGPLTLSDTRVVDNVLLGDPGAVLTNGGIFTAPPATTTLESSVVSGNVPDN